MTTDLVAVPVMQGLWDTVVDQLNADKEFLTELSDAQQLEYVNQNSNIQRVIKRVIDSWNVFVITQSKSDPQFVQNEIRYHSALTQFVKANLTATNDIYHNDIETEIKALVRTRLRTAEYQRPKFARLVVFVVLAQLEWLNSDSKFLSQQLTIQPVASLKPVTTLLTDTYIEEFVRNTIGVKNPELLGQLIVNSSGTNRCSSTGNQAADAVLTYIGMNIV